MFLQPFDHSLLPSRLIWRGPRLEDAAALGVDPELLVRGKAEKAIEESHTRQERLRVNIEIKRKVFEKLSSKRDQIEAFIQAHPKYKEGGGWQKWNADFLATLGETNVLYIGLIQKVLFDHFDLSQDKQAVIDSKMGPYTLAAVATYLHLDLPKYVYNASNARPYLDKLEGYENLGERLSEEDDRRNLEEMLAMPKEVFFDDYQKALENEPDQGSASVDDRLFMEKIDDVLIYNEGKFDSRTANGWRKAFLKAGLSNSEIEAMGLKVNTSINQEKDNKSVSQETSKEIKGSSDIQKFNPSVENAKREAIVESSNSVIKSAVDSYKKELESMSVAIDEQRSKFLMDLATTEKNPDIWWNDIRGVSYLEKLLDDYSTKFKEWKKARNTGENFSALEQEKNTAYTKLSNAVHQHYAKLDAIDTDTLKLYKERIASIASEYDFPVSIPLEAIRNPNDIYKSPFIRSLKQLNHIESYIGTILKSNEPPRRVINSKVDFEQYVKGQNPQEIKSNVERVWRIIESSGNYKAQESINNWIYINNIKLFAQEHQDLLTRIVQQRGQKMAAIRNVA